MRQVLIIAGKELRDGMRNRWVLAITALLAALALTLAFLGAAPTGTVKVSALAVTIVSLSSLTIFLVPLIALLLSYDAIVGEVERGAMALLLAYPVARWQVVLGKFAGHLGILGFATAAGYGVAGVALQFAGNEDSGAWIAFVGMVASSMLLGAVFIAIGYFVSTLVRDRGAAGGIAIGVWLVFVLLYDMALLGVLVADQGRTVTADVLNVLLLLNPTDAYRLLNLTASPDVSGFSRRRRPGRTHWPRARPAHRRARGLDHCAARRRDRPVCTEASMRRRYVLIGLMFLAGCGRVRLGGSSAAPARGGRRLGRPVLRYVDERAFWPESPDLRTRPAEALLVFQRSRRPRIHYIAGNAKGDHRDLRQRHGAREELGSAGGWDVDRGAPGGLCDRQPTSRRHGRGRSYSVRLPRSRREILSRATAAAS